MKHATGQQYKTAKNIHWIFSLFSLDSFVQPVRFPLKNEAVGPL